MRKHIELLGILHVIYHSLGLVIALALLTFFGGRFIISCGDTYLRGMSAAITIYRFVAIGILFAVLLLSITGIIGGIGLLKMRPWGRILALIMGFVSLVRIPFGTALGIYTIWALMNDRTIELFEKAGRELPGGEAT